MRHLLFILIFTSSFSFSAEYGHFFRADNGDSWDQSVTLNEGDRFVFLGSNKTDSEYQGYESGEHCRVGFICDYQGTQITRSMVSFFERSRNYSSYYGWGFGYNRSEASRTITGPCTITPQTDGDDLVVDYKIIRANEEEGGSKFTASLNSEGSRLAIGSKTPGSNAVTRVYEFDGSSWNQLGEDVE